MTEQHSKRHSSRVTGRVRILKDGSFIVVVSRKVSAPHGTRMQIPGSIWGPSGAAASAAKIAFAASDFATMGAAEGNRVDMSHAIYWSSENELVGSCAGYRAMVAMAAIDLVTTGLADIDSVACAADRSRTLHCHGCRVFQPRTSIPRRSVAETALTTPGEENARKASLPALAAQSPKSRRRWY